jgi:hypothetical protein
MNVNVDLSTQQLSELLGVTPRMVNLYRAEAEKLVGHKLGQKRGKVVFFTPEEQELIRQVQQNTGSRRKTVEANYNAPDFTSDNNQAEDGILTGMDAIVQAGDQNAIAIGQQLGQRWNHLLWSSAIQTMQGGMVQMQQQFTELHASVSCNLSDVDSNLLAGNHPETPALESADEDDDYDDAEI